MTDPLTLGVAAATLGLALVTGWLHLPRVPDLEAGRWFDLVLSTLLRGAVEARAGDVDEWERSVARLVPPNAGRGALEARLADPLDLGPAYDLATVVGASWDELAAWGGGDEAFAAALRRRLPVRWVLVRGASTPRDLVGALREEIGDAIEVPWDAERGMDAGVAAVVEAMRAGTPDPADRLVLAADGEGALLVLKALFGEPLLRDRVLGVVAVGGRLAGRDEAGPFGELAVRDWMEAHFGHDALDTEMMRATVYASVPWLDRDVTDQRFPTPKGEPGASSLETVDLGPLPVDPELPLKLVARALWAWTVAWIATRQG